MADRLKGARIAVLFVGPVDPKLQSEITTALGDAGAEELRLRVLKVPINEQALAKRLRGRPFLQAYAGSASWTILDRRWARSSRPARTRRSGMHSSRSSSSGGTAQ